MSDLTEYDLAELRAIINKEILKFIDSKKHPDQAVSDPDFYKLKNYQRELYVGL